MGTKGDITIHALLILFDFQGPSILVVGFGFGVWGQELGSSPT